MDLTTRQWSEAEFEASAQEWEELRSRSDADPLFMSWDWQWLWWRHHRALLEGELRLVACYAGARLVGLAPFYLRSARHRAGITGRRLEIIGSTFRDSRGVFSEYLDLIVDRALRSAVLGALAGHLRADRGWADLVVTNSSAEGSAAELVRAHLARDCSVREVDPLEAHRTALPRDFSEYLAALPGSIRRKVWNHRSKLVEPKLVVAGPDDFGEVFDRIDGFHLERWGERQYVGVARDFHFALAPRLLARGALRSSTLWSGGAPIAVMYNVRLGGTEYNIQSGFDPALAQGMSPGYLHFGYSLEEACRDAMARFDFLAGEGQNRQYKSDFLTTAHPLLTFQAIRARHLKWLYAAHRLLAGRH